jgi:hypothetical protein
VPALEVLGLVLALPEAIVALRELWARCVVVAPAARSRIELEISFRLSIHRG